MRQDFSFSHKHVDTPVGSCSYLFSVRHSDVVVGQLLMVVILVIEVLQRLLLLKLTELQKPLTNEKATWKASTGIEMRTHLSVEAEGHRLVPQRHEEIPSVHFILQVCDHHVD